MRRLPFTGLALSLAFLFATASSALAAPAAERLHVQIWPEQQGSSALLLESAEYSRTMKLPQQVKMAVPKGVRIEWVGEVFGGKDASKDISAKYKVTPRKDYDEISFTLTKARTGQVEADWPAPGRNGSKRTIAFTWIQAFPSGTIDFAFKTPAGASGAQMNPPIAYQNKDTDGLQYYGSGPMSLTPGQRQQVAISYELGNAPGTGRASNSNLTLAILVIVIGGGGVAATLYSQSRKREAA